jgi:peptidyl-prolyl cis-trans isomerase SurA
MNKKIYLWPSFVWVLWLILLGQDVFAQSAQSVDKIVAVVNDKIITASELHEKMHQVTINLQEANTPIPSKKVLREKVLENIILESIQLQLAQRANITVTPEELDKAVNQIVERNHQTLPEFKENLSRRNLSFEEFKKQLTQEITLQKLQGEEVAQDIKLNELAVKELANQLKKQISATLEYHLQDVLVPVSETPSAEELDKARAFSQVLISRLKQGEPFSQVAMANSSGQNALQGGDMGWHTLAGLPEVFALEVSKMTKGSISAPIQTGNGFHIIQLIDTRSEKEALPLESEADRLKRAKELLFQREYSQRLQTWFSQIRSGAYVKVY